MRRTPRARLRHIEKFVVLMPIKLSMKKTLAIGEEIAANDYDLRRIIRWNKTRHIEPVGTRYANYMMDKYGRMKERNKAKKEPEIIVTDAPATHRERLLAIAKSNNIRVDKRWNDERLEKELSKFIVNEDDG